MKEINHYSHVIFSQEFINEQLKLISPDVTSVCFYNLNAVQENYDKINAFLHDKCDIGGVVKANAYGFGAQYIAYVLYKYGCRNFFVSTIQEGKEVNEALSNPDFFTKNITDNKKCVCIKRNNSQECEYKIYSFNGLLKNSFDLFVKNNIIPVLTSCEQIDEFISENEKLYQTIGKKISACIHIDTGMTRNGLSQEDAIAYSQKILSNIDIDYIVSHFACADLPEHPMNQHQLQMFKHITDMYYPNIKRTLCNSNGAMLGHEYQFDLVRSGKSLYGFAIREDSISTFTPVIYWYSRIVQINKVKKGTNIGYGGACVAQSDMTTITIGLGYNDGFFRKFSSIAHVMINNRLAPILGRISMDYIIIDVSHIDMSNIKTGYWVTITDDQHLIEQWSLSFGTIPHEITCTIGRRIFRKYFYNLNQ